jgi:hypothetical protein
MKKSGIADQVISPPQGGGAIRGLGESLISTLAGNLTVPIAVPAGRNKFQPDLSLVYSTGHGNGPFGLGWALSIPGVVHDPCFILPGFSFFDRLLPCFEFSSGKQD